MSQNDELLKLKGLPILSPAEKNRLRGKWQAETWDDMLLSLHSYGKYIMLRPTGFGKTYTCACACNIGHKSKDSTIQLNNGGTIKDPKLASIYKKRVIFVYISEILKQTFEEYDTPGEKQVIVENLVENSRVHFETYSMLSKHWNDPTYLHDVIDIDSVGLVIFDEVQRMGARETKKALDVAIPILDRLGIYYIGATATIERATGVDVCDEFFTYKHPNGKLTYCWGEHIYTLDDCFKSGLLIPPEYQYIEENQSVIKKARHTRLSMLQELKAELVNPLNEDDKSANFKDMEELERAVIKNSSKIIHDTMLMLYNCNNSLIDDSETLKKVPKNSLPFPTNLPRYMRFLVFTPDRLSLGSLVKDTNSDDIFGGMVNQTYKSFKNAFERYGYKVRTVVISSLNATERNAVKRLDARNVSESEVESEDAIVPTDMTIDLIFSINMLNVGYHVKHITGLIFKRWTGSNQIFYQQLGRCLSVDSDNIPVVFDFVKSIDSRGITAPMFTIDKQTKEVTENADGTHNTAYNKKEKSKGKKINRKDLLLDNEGNLIDPRKCNVINAKYITVSTTSASVDDIISRYQVYEERANAKELYDIAYKKYMSYIDVHQNNLVSDIRKIPTLDSSLRLAILQVYGDKVARNLKGLTVNFKSYVEYLKKKESTVFVEYNAIKKYMEDKKSGAKFKGLSHEVNTLLASSKDDKTGIKGNTIKVILNTNQVEDFKSNKEVLNALNEKGIQKQDVIMYTL